MNEDILNQIKYLYQKEHIQVGPSVESFMLNVNQAIPLGMMVNELVVNAFQYAFDNEKEGDVTVEILRNNRRITAMVKDNGKGLPSSDDFEDPDNLGFVILQQLKKQLRADIDVESDAQGTLFRVEFEEKKMTGSASNIADDVL